MGDLLAAVVDLWRGLFGFPDHPTGTDVNAAAAIEARYSRPRRCC